MKRAVITGARRGIGKAIAERFESAGYSIISPTRAELELSDSAAVDAFASTLPLADVLINNAGENKPLALAQIRPSDFERIMTVNVTAPYLLSRAVGTKMAQASGGRIVNISSIYAHVSREGRSMYSTSKAAIDGMTRALAVELGAGGVIVNSLCPGFVDTDLTRQNNTPEEIERLCSTIPLGRLASTSEIADLAFFLGSEANSYITGQSIIIDGGFLCR